MKKRQLTTMLLIWLFSQQLLAAVWSTPPANIDCINDSQNDCFSAITHMGHIMPSNSDSSSSGISMMCDHCSTVCQTLLISHHLLGLIQETHSTSNTPFIDTPINALPSTLYRPPISA
ncbi:hypothetical protein ACVBE9_01765 [Eionea flava]